VICEHVCCVLTGTLLTRCLQGSTQSFAGGSGDMRAVMLCSNRDAFDAVFAGFCAEFRRGERVIASRDAMLRVFPPIGLIFISIPNTRC
jgi:hypothetical protein